MVVFYYILLYSIILSYIIFYYIILYYYTIKSVTTNRKNCVRNLHRRLPSTIPHKIPGFFDGNLGTYCICNESAASTSSFPFWVVETRSCKRFKESGNFCKNGLSHVTFWFFFQKIPEFVSFCDEKFQGFPWFLKSILFSISSKIPGSFFSFHKYIIPS